MAPTANFSSLPFLGRRCHPASAPGHGATGSPHQEWHLSPGTPSCKRYSVPKKHHRTLLRNEAVRSRSPAALEGHQDAPGQVASATVSISHTTRPEIDLRTWAHVNCPVLVRVRTAAVQTLLTRPSAAFRVISSLHIFFRRI